VTSEEQEVLLKMKHIATLVAAMMLGSVAVATGPAKKMAAAYAPKSWTINLGLAMPSGDHKDDLDVDSMFMVGLDYGLGMMGDGSDSATFVGIMGMFGSGSGSLDSRTYGVHYGVLMNLGGASSNMPLKLKLQGGYYNTRLSNGGDEDEWGFGGLAGLVWTPNTSGGNPISFEGGIYFFPEVANVNNTGWYFAVGIPFSSK
jgi:hypothetical protein